MYQINSKADEDVVKVILANKCDVSGRNSVADEKRVVETYAGRILAEKYKASFMEVSAKENIGIFFLFFIIHARSLSTDYTALLLPYARRDHSSGIYPLVKFQPQWVVNFRPV